MKPFTKAMSAGKIAGQKNHLDGKTEEQLRKDSVLNEEKGLMHQLPDGESG